MSENAILILTQNPAALRPLESRLRSLGLRVLFAREADDLQALLSRDPIGLVLGDARLLRIDDGRPQRRLRTLFPLIPLVVLADDGCLEEALVAMREGAHDCLLPPFDGDEGLERVQRLLPPVSQDEFVSGDARMRKLHHLARRVAANDVTVILAGESGTGKEVLARFIHRHSTRADGPFIAVNCAAIPADMMEALLFGHEKGAFTGALKASPGKFELAQGGTLLLDEISEIDLDLQAKLLRVLQEREVERVGGHELIPLDVRVIATTNRNLREEVSAGRFREDLYYRLNVFPLLIPPLRERPGDILPLARVLLARHARPGAARPEFSDEARRMLLEHRWPGNVRELENVVQRALIMCDGECIEAGDLRFEEETAPLPPRPGGGGGPLSADLRSVEEQRILETLRHRSRKEAAELLGISPRTLRYKIARMRDAGVSIPGRQEWQP